MTGEGVTSPEYPCGNSYNNTSNQTTEKISVISLTIVYKIIF